MQKRKANRELSCSSGKRPAAPAQRSLPLLIGFALGVMTATPAAANPTGAQVVNGAATFARPDAHTLEVTNTPNAIINWQQFNIGANETTRFIQQSATSAVLNRVVGLNPSEILGQLQSNGQVYLINPNGIVFGHNAVIDTAAFIGATLNMTDADFLAGRHRFEGPEGAGSITNHGVIKARDDGGVYLVAPEIENDGIIRTDDGQILLAAGRKLTISSLDVAHISFEVQAPEDSVVNLGELLTSGGAASVFARNIHNAGRIRASGISRDADGRIVLNAGPSGRVKLTADSELVASRGADGGSIHIDGGQSLEVSGRVEAVGTAGNGGQVDMTADTVMVDDAVIDASGDTGGGRVRIGGEYQGGKNLAEDELRNAVNLTITETGVVRAEATGADGDGGDVVIWADQVTGFLGEVYARPGEESGAGGNVEVSGLEFLQFRGSVESGRGERHGHLLLDPKDIVIATGGVDDPANATFNTSANGTFTIDPNTLSTLLGAQNVTLQANNDITVNNSVGFAGPANSLTLQAGRSINVNADMNFTAANNITMTANERTVNGVVNAERDAGAGGITMAAGTNLSTLGNLRLIVEDDAAKTNNTSGDILLANVSAAHVELVMFGSTDDSDVLSRAGTSITATSVFVDHFPNAGGPLGNNGDIGTVAQPLRVSATSFAGHLHHAGEVNVELLNQGSTNIGDTFFGIGKGITGVQTGTDQGGGNVNITSLGDIEVLDDIRVRGGNLFLQAGSDGTGSLRVDMDAAVNLGAGAVATTPDVVDIVVGTSAGDSGTMTLTAGTDFSVIGADGVNSTVNIDVFGSGAQNITTTSGDLDWIPGTGGGTATINLRSGQGGTGANGGGQQTFNIGGNFIVSAPVSHNPFDVEISATNGRQLFQVDDRISLEAGTSSNSVIDVLGAGSVSGGFQQDFQLNFALTPGVGQFTIDTGIAGNTGGTDNKVNVSANGAQSVDLRGTNSGLTIKGDSVTADPANFFAALGAGGDQTVAVQGNSNLFIAAGQAPALLTSGGAQTITVTDGGVNMQPLTGADKETRIQGATQVINADFMQVFGGDIVSGSDAIVRSLGNQDINITTAGGQTFTMRGGISGANGGQALLDAGGTLTLTNNLGAILVGNGAQNNSSLLLANALNVTGQGITFAGGDQFNAVARASITNNVVMNSTNTIALNAGTGSFAQATVSAGGDLDVQATGNIAMTGNNNAAATATFTGNTISRFNSGANLSMTAASAANSGGTLIQATGGALSMDITGTAGITGGGVGTSGAQSRILAQNNMTLSFGGLLVTAGGGTNADAIIESTSGSIALTTTGSTTLNASLGGSSSEAVVEAPNGVTANIGTVLNVTGGPALNASADFGTIAGTLDVTTGAGLNITAGGGQNGVASLFGNTVILDVTGAITVSAGAGDSALAGIEASLLQVDATGNVTVNGGSGNGAAAGLGHQTAGSTVVLGNVNPIGGSVALTSGTGTGARAFVGTNCGVGPCNATVSIDADTGITLTGPTITSVVGSRTALTGDTGGSVSLVSSTGTISLSNQSVTTRGAITISGVGVTQTAAATLGGLVGQSLNVSSSGAIDLQSTVNDFSTLDVTTTAGGNVDIVNDATLTALNGTSLTVNSVAINAGAFTLSNTGPTIVNGTIAPLGLGGDVTINTFSPLTINAPVTGRNFVTLVANAGGADDDIIINAPVTSPIGAVTITADDSISVQSPISAVNSSIALTATNGSIEGPGLMTALTVNLNAPLGSVGDLGTVFVDALGVGFTASNSVDISVFNNPGITVPAISLTGDFFLESDGPIGQSGPFTVGGNSDFTSFFGDVNLNLAGNSFGGGLSASALDPLNSVFIAGTGTLQLNGGFLPASANYAGFTQVVNNGVLSLPDGAVLGAGSNFVNNGVIEFGNSPGVLTVVGNLTLGPSSVLVIEVSDLDLDLDGLPDTDFLDVTGTLTLGGELEIQPIDGFVGDPDIELDVIQCGSCVGSFDLVSAFPAILTVDIVDDPSLTSFVTIVTTPSDDSLDPTSDILADLDALDELEALEEELLEAELEVALEDDDEESDEEDDGPTGALICL